jgi:predicted metal-dependent enzyme (double-stranded beta helix superfamily)
MFDVERFVEDCRSALKEDDSHKAVREVVARAVTDPAAVVRGLGAPARAGVETLFRADDLTVLNVLWGPRMTMHPHNHRMWAVIGMYGGQEDNTFFRRTESGIEVASAKSLLARDTAPLGRDIIHAVHNQRDSITAAIHVYGGDFFAVPRSEWDPDTLAEHPYDVEHTRRVFEDSNLRPAQPFSTD